MNRSRYKEISETLFTFETSVQIVLFFAVSWLASLRNFQFIQGHSNIVLPPLVPFCTPAQIKSVIGPKKTSFELMKHK